MSRSSFKRSKKGPLFLIVVIAALILVELVPWFISRLQENEILPGKNQILGSSGPIDAVDYIGQLNEKQSAGVRPEQNAAVDYYRIWGLTSFDAQQKQELIKWLGTDPFESGQPASIALNPIEQQFDDWPVEAWKAEDYPELAARLSELNGELDRVVEATEKPKFYLPAISLTEDAPMLNISLELSQNCRTLIRGLQLRSTLRVGEGDAIGARSDIQAMHRMARHLAMGPALVSGLVGISMEITALLSGQELINSGLLNQRELLEFGTYLRDLPPITDLRTVISEVERSVLLDSAQALGLGANASVLTQNPKPQDKSSRAFKQNIDWDITMGIINSWYDEVDRVMAIKDPKRREIEWKSLDRELASFGQQDLIIGAYDRKTRSENMGNILSGLMMPACNAAMEAEDRTLMVRELTFVAAMLQAFYVEHKKYPEQLSELVPDYLEQLPTDRFQQQAALKYEVTEAGFKVYSVGNNFTDNGGVDGLKVHDLDNGDLVVSGRASPFDP